MGFHGAIDARALVFTVEQRRSTPSYKCRLNALGDPPAGSIARPRRVPLTLWRRGDRSRCRRSCHHKPHTGRYSRVEACGVRMQVPCISGT